MKIKKLIKKEASRQKRRVVISLAVIVLMSYIVISLKEENIFSGWELYFAYAYLVVVDSLLLMNIFRTVSDNIFQFNIVEQRLRIKDGIIKPHFSINLDSIVYVDIAERDKYEFEVLIVLEKGKRNKSLKNFDKQFISDNSGFRQAYNKLSDEMPEGKLYCYLIKKRGAYKYYYLYLLYKNVYNGGFSQRSLQYIKSFIDEYNLK